MKFIPNKITDDEFKCTCKSSDKIYIDEKIIQHPTYGNIPYHRYKCKKCGEMWSDVPKILDSFKK